MSINLLHYVLATELSAFFLIFCRIGAAMLSLPGFSEVYVPVRVRLLFALLFSMMLTPMLMPQIPPMPGTAFMLLVLMAQEITVGIFIGLLVRSLISVTHVAGTIIASQSSLAVGAIFDPNSGATSPVISNILGLAAMTLFFVLDFHHLALAALVKSYNVFTAGQFIATGDMANLSMRWMADAFSMGVLLASPHIIFSLLFYLMGGLMTRLMPNFQVFFIFISPQVMIALLLFLALIPMMLEMYTTFLDDHLRTLIAAG